MINNFVANKELAGSTFAFIKFIKRFSVKLSKILIYCLLCSANICAQDHLVIEGDLDVEGRISLADTGRSLCLGDHAGANHNGAGNLFVGDHAGSWFVQGNENTMVGANSGFLIDSGRLNTIFGSRIPFFGGSGYQIDGCTIIGERAGNPGYEGSENTVIGHAAGNGGLGDYNSYLGVSAGRGVDSVHAATSLGFEAGHSNKASSNCFVGGLSGRHNTSGSGNTFFGTSSGYHNDNGEQNTTIGLAAGFENRQGNYNVFIGSSSGRNSRGFQNTYLGFETGRQGINSDVNTFMGWHAGYLNEGICNVFLGSAAGSVIQGDDNVLVGQAAGSGSTNASACIAVGFEAGFNGNYSNSMALGAGAKCNASNKVRIGNQQVSVIEGQVNFSAVSDYRLKENFNDSKAGLSFIQKLRPVNYQWKEGDDNFHTGLIAQDVEKAADELGYHPIGISRSEDQERIYALRYAELVMPLIDALIELVEMNQSLYQRLEELEQAND